VISTAIQKLRKHKFIFIAVTGVVGLGLIFVVVRARERKRIAPPPAPLEVDVVQVHEQTVPIYSEWIGTTDGMVNADIRSQVSGYLLLRNYTEGAFVRTGQLLFEIDPRPFEAVVNQVKADLARAEAQLGQAVMADMKRRFPNDLEYAITLDTTQVVTEGITEIVKTLFIAVALVILVVFIFLQNWRATLIPVIAVPVSLIGTFAVFPFLGFSINTLSLFALVLAIGLVVDDAIVVVEAVEHQIEEGLSPRDATLLAMKEVSGPVVAIALILSPALSALLLRPRTQSKGFIKRLFDLFNRGFESVSHGYVSLSHALIRKAVIAVVILAGFAIADGFLGYRLPASFIPSEDYGYAYINVQLPPAASTERTDVALKKVEDILSKTQGVQYYTMISGFSLLSRVTTSYQGFFFVALKPWEERGSAELEVDGIVKTLNTQMAQHNASGIGAYSGNTATAPVPTVDPQVTIAIAVKRSNLHLLIQ